MSTTGRPTPEAADRNHPDRDRPATTGHSWDGIEEYDNPLPRWWLWVFWATVVFALGYTVFYPAWPLWHKATPGILHETARGDLVQDMARWEADNRPLEQKLLALPLADVSQDPELMSYALNAGASVFRTWCAQCHGAGAGGQPGLGFPSLLDRDWLWGGTLDDIYTTVAHGIRDPHDPDTRITDMPAFGRDQILTPKEIGEVVQHVRQISGQSFDPALAAPGAQIFADNCAACHGDQGKGDRSMGAPDLTDAVWLYGGSVAAITRTVTGARNGVMPSWSWAPAGGLPRLSEADIRAVALYVHSLGGGE